MRIKSNGFTWAHQDGDAAGSPIVPGTRYALPGHDGHFYQVLEAGRAYFVVLIKHGKKVVQRAQVPVAQECTLTLDPNAELFPMGDTLSKINGVLQGRSSHLRCQIVDGPVLTTREVHAGAWRIITDGTTNGYTDLSTEEDLITSEYFVVTDATYAIAVGKHAGTLCEVHIWEGADTETVIEAIQGV